MSALTAAWVEGLIVMETRGVCYVTVRRDDLIAALRAREKVERERDEWYRGAQERHKMLIARGDRIAELEAEIARLREARDRSEPGVLDGEPPDS